MLRRRYIEECYSKITTRNPEAASHYERKSKERMLRDYFSFYQFGRREPLPDEDVWNIYASKQRAFYLRMNIALTRYTEEQCPCYICARVTEKSVVGDWYAVHLLHPDLSGCYENFNTRVVCHVCCLMLGFDNPNTYALSLGRTRNNSLAIEERIETLERAIMLYFHSYAPHSHRCNMKKIRTLVPFPSCSSNISPTSSSSEL